MKRLLLLPFFLVASTGYALRPGARCIRLWAVSGSAIGKEQAQAQSRARLSPGEARLAEQTIGQAEMQAEIRAADWFEGRENFFRRLSLRMNLDGADISSPLARQTLIASLLDDPIFSSGIRLGSRDRLFSLLDRVLTKIGESEKGGPRSRDPAALRGIGGEALQRKLARLIRYDLKDRLKDPAIFVREQLELAHPEAAALFDLQSSGFFVAGDKDELARLLVIKQALAETTRSGKWWSENQMRALAHQQGLVLTSSPLS